jgi:predicted  nucleic acid-binding Zn-ribbon protein
MDEQIKHYLNLIKEKSEEIATLRTQVQHFSQEAEKPSNFITKHLLQEASKIKHLRMKQAEEAIRLYMELVNGKNEVIRQCHTKIMEKRETEKGM